MYNNKNHIFAELKSPNIMQHLPIGIQNFEKLRNNNLKYVDKTAILYNLVTSGCYYFLSRPRRFGKSLFLSTLEAYFQGKKELFQGLAIEQLEKDWIEYPILHLDLNTEKYATLDALLDVLNEILIDWEKEYGVNEAEKALGRRFQGVIRRAYEKTGKQVVILVDEYDKPLLQAIGNSELQDAYRATLKSFYGALKSCDQYIRFAFLTGVTKFSKVSIFSDLNNLVDISMMATYYNICGITEEELHTQLHEHIEQLALYLEESTERVYAQLKERYDGYRFTKEERRRNEVIQGIYNPFSLLNAIQYNALESYWFETGTPTYLVELLKRYDYNLANLEKEEVTADELQGIEASNPIPVIYQSGYLTIKGYEPEFGVYKLGFPNREVKEGFIRFLVPYYTSKNDSTSFDIRNFVLALRRGNIEDFMLRLQTFLSACPYEIQAEQERHFQSMMFILSSLCGFYTELEKHTNKGRMDMTIKTDQYIYLFEFKFNSTAEIALQQIYDKGYAEPYKMDGRQIVCVGVNYSSEARNIDKWIVE